jgi:hypothetical protein
MEEWGPVNLDGKKITTLFSLAIIIIIINIKDWTL